MPQAPGLFALSQRSARREMKYDVKRLHRSASCKGLTRQSGWCRDPKDSSPGAPSRAMAAS